MSADRSKPVLESDAVEAALAAHGFGTDRARSGAAILALLDPPRVIWANRAATQLFDTTDAGDLDAQVFAGRGREGLGESVARLPADGSPRLERLRLIRGFRSRTLTMLINRMQLEDGRGVVVMSAPGHDLSSGEAADFAISALRAPEPPPRVSIAQADPPAAGLDAASPDVARVDFVDAALRDRLAALGSSRVLWQTDGEHRIVKLAQGVPEMVGIDDASLVGRPLADLMQTMDADPEGRLAAALDGRVPFSGVGVRWPLAGAPAAVVVMLGAMPIVTRGGFGGFRGFGVADLVNLVPAPPRAAVEAPERPVVEATQDNVPTVAALMETTPAPPARAAAPVEAVPSISVRVTTEAFAAAEEVPSRFSSSAKVVPLRPYQSFGGFGAAPPTDPLSTLPPPVTPDDDDVLDLSSIEHSNFQEIGRTLLAREPVAELSAAAPLPMAQSMPSPPEAPSRAAAASLFESLAIGLLVVDGDRLLDANPAFASLTGYGSLDVLRAAGGLPHLFGGLDPRGVLVADADRAVPLTGASGEVIALDGRLQSIAWREGPASLLTLRPAAHGVQATGLDDQIRRRDADLAETRALVDQAADPLLIVDRQGRIVSANEAARQLFGTKEPMASGETVATLLGVAAQAALTRGGAPADGIDVTGRSATGQGLPLRMTWRALGPEKIGIGLRGQGGHASVERELAETRGRLDQALADKPDLLAKISHELRTPLNAILGFAEVILDERFGPVGNVRYKAYLRDIHESGRHVLSLLNDMLDLSNMQAGRLDMHPAAIDVNRVIGGCVGEMQTTAHRERVIMRLSLLPHLSAALVDERAFRQVVGNILSNAINFNEPGGQVIVSTAMNEGGAVAVRIRDTGIGMTEAEISQALEPFRQIKTAKPGTGNGLGLPLARALVDANGASMSIRSRKGEGTLVEIVLPACPAEPMRMPA